MRTLDRYFIGGEWVTPSGDEVVELPNPATEEIVGTAIVPAPADAERAIAAARAAFDHGPWPSMSPAERGAILRAMAAHLRARKREIGELLIETVGATVALAKSMQGTWAIDAFDLSADWAESFPWEAPIEPQQAPIPVEGFAMREPVGVVTGMTPFNYPFFVNAWKVAPALAMGNTFVLKPSPWTPLDAFEIARAAEAAGLPAGVLNVIGGGGVDVGQVLASHPMVDMVSFTGSVAGGRAVGAAAMQTVKKVQLELGGKSAGIALDDADPAEVAGIMLGRCMVHAGQGCGCITRLLVPAARHDDFVEPLVEACRAATVGDPADPATLIGPLIRDEHRARVEAHIAHGIDQGATLACGGGRPAHLPKGYFVEPTVFTGVRNDMAIAQEEIFGPVLCVIPYADVDDAVRIANDSIFGLSGAVFATDPERARAVARRMRTGYVGLGYGMISFNGGWGGYRQSGVGREWRQGLEEFTEVKVVSW